MYIFMYPCNICFLPAISLSVAYIHIAYWLLPGASRPGRASLSFLPPREPHRDPDEEASPDVGIPQEGTNGQGNIIAL